MVEDIHGFCPNEVVDLYRFFCVYVKNLEHIGSQENFEKLCPELKKVEILMSDFVCNYCSRESLKIIGIVPVENLVSMTKCRSSKPLSFLHHLRNSIAHGQIEQENGYVHLIDYGLENGNKVFSSRGKIKSSTLFGIINIINENIMLS